MPYKVGALLLAAGFSRRFGSRKLAAGMPDGRPLIEHTLANLETALDHILIVSRPGALDDWEPGNRSLARFDGAEQGMGASLAFGVSRLSDWDGCLVCLADMPFIQPQTYALLAGQLAPDRILIPRHNDRRGNPVGFGSHFFPDLARLDSETGGRRIIETNKHFLREITVEDPAILQDIDTPEDLRRFQQPAS